MLISHQRKWQLLKKHHFRYRKSTVLKSIVFLTFEINEINTFQKVIISKNRQRYQVRKHLAEFRKCLFLKTNTFRKSIKNYMNYQWFWNKKALVFLMILIDFQKIHDFKIKRFLIPVQKVYDFPMLLKQESVSIPNDS